MILRQVIVRLAHAEPSLRKYLVPLLRKEAARTEYAEYKGRNYILLWVGATKFGERAHLQFADGSKDFWVDASLIQKSAPPAKSCPVPPKRNPQKKYECGECGDYVFPGTKCWETGCIH